QVPQVEGVEQIVVNQQRVWNAAPERFAGKPVIILRPVPDVVQIGLAVAAQIEARVRRNAVEQTLVVIPIRGVDCYSAVPIAMLCQESTQAIPHLRRCSFLEKRKSEPSTKAGVPAQYVISAQDALLELFRRCLSHQWNVIVGVVADSMACRAPEL